MNAMIGEAEYRKSLPHVAGKAFLFFGDEDYLKNNAVKLTRAALCPDESFAIFNDITIDAPDYTPDRLLDAMMPPPMMADTRLILLRNLNTASMRAGELEDLFEVLRQLPEYDYNTVIIYVAAGVFDEGILPKRPSALLKKFAEVATPVRFETQSESKLALWVARHFAHRGLSASPDACRHLIELVGTGMFVLANEIEKLAAFALFHGQTAVTLADIDTVAAPNLTSDTFALSNAIIAGAGKEALSALAVLKFQRTDPVVVMGEVARTLSDMQSVKLLLDSGKSAGEIAADLSMNEYKVKRLMRAVSSADPRRLSRAIALAADADRILKSGSADYAPIERLVCAL